MEKLLQERNPGQQITSSTLPKKNQRNVRLAGKRHEKTGVVFDERGLLIMEEVKFDTRISYEIASIQKREPHMKAATEALRDAINAGKIDSRLFTEKQLSAIQKGKAKIPDHTWHHHQDKGRMQLVRQEIHLETGHVGGMDLWFFGEKK